MNFMDWICGGYNLPSDDQVDAAPLHKPEASAGAGFVGWICGGYNLPSESSIEKAPIHKPEDNRPPTGFLAWLDGGFNVPRLVPRKPG